MNFDTILKIIIIGIGLNQFIVAFDKLRNQMVKDYETNHGPVKYISRKFESIIRSEIKEDIDINTMFTKNSNRILNMTLMNTFIDTLPILLMSVIFYNASFNYKGEDINAIVYSFIFWIIIATLIFQALVFLVNVYKIKKQEKKYLKEVIESDCDCDNCNSIRKENGINVIPKHDTDSNSDN